MQSTASFTGERRFLAGGAFACLGSAPLSLPVRPKRPRFGVGFHCAQLTLIYGVLLYPILDSVPRHACCLLHSERNLCSFQNTK